MRHSVGHKDSGKGISIILTAIIVILIIGAFAKLNDFKNQNRRMEAEIHDLKSAVQKLEAGNSELKSANQQLAEQIEGRNKAYRTEIFTGLADIKTLDSSVMVDLKYAGTDNFTKKQIYPGGSRALLRRETAVKLLQAIEIFKKDGYVIKIFDAYRPLSAQKILWDHSPIPGFLANPDTGSNHNRGASIDMTLVGKDGKELTMPTGFDDFTEKAARDYANHSEEAKKNMDYMTNVMVSCGFKGIRTEWWHFDDVNAGSYPLLDVGLDSF